MSDPPPCTQAPEQRSGEIEFALTTSQRSPCLAAVLVADGQLSDMLSGSDVVSVLLLPHCLGSQNCCVPRHQPACERVW